MGDALGTQAIHERHGIVTCNDRDAWLQTHTGRQFGQRRSAGLGVDTASIGAVLIPGAKAPRLITKSDLKEIKDIVDSALGTHLASVHEEITDLRNELKQEVNELRRDLLRVETTLTAKIDHVDEKLGNFENREIDKDSMRNNRI